MKTKSKYKLVRDNILRDIRNGKYAPNTKLPAERQLAEESGVSYMTARQAITELVESNLLVRRNREGVFLASDAEARIGKSIIHFICSAYESPVYREFLRSAQEEAERCGYGHHLVRVNPSQMRSIVRLVSSGEPCILFCCGTFMDDQLMEAIQKAKDTVVSVGTDLSMVGVRSVMCDDHMATRSPIDLLKANGHKKIAFIVHNLEDANEQLKISVWKSCFGDQDAADVERRLIVAPTPSFECASAYVYDAVTKYLKSGHADATAFMCLLDESCVGAMAACRACGYRLPEDISFVCFHDTSILRFLDPPVTAVDADVPGHIRVALEMLKKSRQGELRFISPRIIERQSIQAIQE